MTVGASHQAFGRSKSRTFQVALLDLDDTLYRNHAVPEKVYHCIQEYMLTKLGYSKEEVSRKTTELYLAHGTTLAGLVAAGHKIDYDDWHKEVHYGVLDYEHMLHPDAGLRDILCRMDMPKYILTNADHTHAIRCLDRLGISDCFAGIYDFERMMQLGEAHGLISEEHPAVLCKPNPKAYQLILEQIGVSPHEAIFFDDSIRNLQGAHQLGMFTVLVGRDETAAGVDLALHDMHALPAAMPALLDQPGLVHDAHAHGVEAGEHQPKAVEVLV